MSDANSNIQPPGFGWLHVFLELKKGQSAILCVLKSELTKQLLRRKRLSGLTFEEQAELLGVHHKRVNTEPRFNLVKLFERSVIVDFEASEVIPQKEIWLAKAIRNVVLEHCPKRCHQNLDRNQSNCDDCIMWARDARHLASYTVLCHAKHPRTSSNSREWLSDCIDIRTGRSVEQVMYSIVAISSRLLQIIKIWIEEYETKVEQESRSELVKEKKLTQIHAELEKLKEFERLAAI
jgi:hypothetical protein